jgi:hypothetical protein
MMVSQKFRSRDELVILSDQSVAKGVEGPAVVFRALAPGGSAR